MIGPWEMEHVRQRRKELLREAARARLARRARRRARSMRGRLGGGLQAVGKMIFRAGQSLEREN